MSALQVKSVMRQKLPAEMGRPAFCRALHEEAGTEGGGLRGQRRLSSHSRGACTTWEEILANRRSNVRRNGVIPCQAKQHLHFLGVL